MLLALTPGYVERAIANARKVLYQAEVVGDAMCDRDLELMMAYGDIDMNQGYCF